MYEALVWLKTWTVFWLVLALIVVFALGWLLRRSVETRALHPTLAVRFIETVAVVLGGGVGSIFVVVLLIILWPSAGNWVINTFLPAALIWQTEFQQWITQKIADPITSSTIGLLIQRVQFGSAFIGFVSGWLAKWIIETVMGKSYHLKSGKA
jgi:hypothetical protein